MRQESSGHPYIYGNAHLKIARVRDQARKAAPIAVLFSAVLMIGFMCLKPNVMMRTRGRTMSNGGRMASLRWWPGQTVFAQGSNGLTFTVFDAPGAGSGALEGTIGTSINDAGEIAGVHLTAPNVAHGFVRTIASGTATFANVNAPHAGTSKNQGTFPASINVSGDVAGMYFDSSNAYHGFIYAGTTGNITEFDVPNAPTNIGHRGTLPMSINAGGDVAGFWVDTNDIRHGFVRAANGTFTSFDAPNAALTALSGTVPLAINIAGDIVGFYKDSSLTTRGFLRKASSSTFTNIDAPGAGTGAGGKISFVGTLPTSINAADEVAGIYSASGVYHGFVYTAGSNSPSYTAIDVSGSGTTGLVQGPLP
jgi:hypothetical protein